MREILFRGKRLDNGEWVQGWLYKRLVHLDGCHQNVVVDAIEVYDGKNPLSIAYYTVDPATVGQYTGLTDKNGERIFEGDIVDILTENEEIGVVAYEDGGFLVNADGFCVDFHSNINGTDLEVIGNLHDNQELLEGAT